ncbi:MULTISPECIES: hypothetical protein [Sphingomonas]|jgi:hypothetical protein|uniref:hypothetical protein n=1 Tax=Sphingomonas TaxID=13687 RepID=UPI00097880F8|nr:hypothetical protein [Sphingomonas sp. Sph1(2015)]OMJ33653.1 hypothetical protein BSZ14_02095 [Sphingomonas sp. Sph1(2015)]
MRLGLIAVAALTMTTAATGQTAEQGQYASQLRTMLTAVAGGTCSEALMGEGLLKACREQLPQMAPAIKAAGAIQSVKLDKAQDANGQRYEKYTVSFASGKPSTWVIGGLKDGRFEAVYSLGD